MVCPATCFPSRPFYPSRPGDKPREPALNELVEVEQPQVQDGAVASEIVRSLLTELVASWSGLSQAIRGPVVRHWRPSGRRHLVLFERLVKGSVS